MLGDKSYTVEIIVKDVESNSDTAASRAGELILDDGVDMMLAIATPEMINPVADQCEANGVPCLSHAGAVAAVLLRPRRRSGGRLRLDVPLLLGRRAARRRVRRACGTRSTPTRRSACCAPTIPTATPSPMPTTGFPAGAAAGGYTRGRPRSLRGADRRLLAASSASSRTRASRSSSASRSRPTSPRSGRRPSSRASTPSSSRWPRRCCSRRPSRRSATSATAWPARSGGRPPTRSRSSLTGESSHELSDKYEDATGKQWTQFVGFVHALFEVAFDVLARAGSTDKQAIADAAAATNLDTIVGPVQFGANGVPKNISPTSLVGGQWQKTGRRRVPVRPAWSPTTRCRRRSRSAAR